MSKLFGSIDTEVWRDIRGYEGKYQVSSLGRVRSLNRVSSDCNNVQKHLVGKIKTPSESNGYLSLSLYSGKNQYQNFLVHRLVADAFVDNPDPETRTQVNHIDGNTKNNTASNLEWVTPSENIQHAHRRGLFDDAKSKRDYYRMGKLSALQRQRAVVCAETGDVYPSLKSAAEHLNITVYAVLDSCKDGRPHRGYTFRYCDELNVSEDGTFIVPDDPIKQRKHLACPVYCVELDRTFDSRSAAAKFLGISDSSVRDSIRDGKQHCGYTFRNVLS